MEASHSTASVYSSREDVTFNRDRRLRAPVCNCCNIAKIYTSWKETNPGRRFYGCPNYHVGGGCGFFRWIDPEIGERLMVLLNELHNERLMLRRDNRRLRIDMERGSDVIGTIDDVRRAMDEKEMVEEKLKVCNRKKEMYKFGLVLSWIVIGFVIVIALV
ncbi:uncharacterized protein LOC126678415 [Mercurialis annua]|uniref:uncharacterized protein LOC126678415 n=1 Tax=Mercurialis annua TaxID=3986 RepID=UPI00215F2F3D|nr:uncharacterized protein LOC126678415 [Mercurialis annua]